MTTNMVRKQFYITKRQDELLKRYAQVRGLSEAEIIRQAIDQGTSGMPGQPAEPDRSAWNALMAFLDTRQASARKGRPYFWNREEIYAERESHWLRDRKDE